MGDKIIIDNRTSKPIKDILPYVQFVTESGRISDSGKSYCYVTKFGAIYVSAKRNKASDTFVVWEETGTEKPR